MTKKKKYTVDSLPTNDGKAHFLEDGWNNFLTGMGVIGKDKSMGASVVHNKLNQRAVEELYAADDIAARIVDRLPKDGTREWIQFQNLDKDVEGRLNDVIKKLDLKAKFRRAWSFSRLYGGSGLLINFGEAINGKSIEKLKKPVNEGAIREVKSLTLLNRYELESNSQIITDINDPSFGLPESYDVTPQTSEAARFNVHHTRVIRFDGATLPTELFVQNEYWDDSVLTKVFQTISNFNQGHNASASMLLDFRVAIIKLKNLFQMIASGDEKKVKDRMELIKMQKSVINMILLSEGEEFEHKTHSLAGVNEVLEHINRRMVAASGYPHTILLGESPSGLGATGESEIRDYYDMVSQEQEDKLRKPLEQIFRYIFLSKIGPTNGKIPENFDFDFVPLWQLTDIERAKMELDVARKDEIYIANQVLDPDEVALSRYGGKDFSQDTVIDPTRSREAEPDEPEEVQRQTTTEIEVGDANIDKIKNRVWDKIKAVFRNDSTT